MKSVKIFGKSKKIIFNFPYFASMRISFPPKAGETGKWGISFPLLF